ncbi:hypothetical protein FOMPIDRAFT_1056353 [Fomitopsis schrenkii]|uniref:Uncharacterized protein n=1 Tax=Fomitopsis schrenkii TaxID=2126942 RepID=S8ETH5_FOMSC|nr:hypothetical protein FOMPIDRAFT_1056353 [Fomitopsis schrenkii]
MSQSCSWYKKGKLKEIFDLDSVFEAHDGGVTIQGRRTQPEDEAFGFSEASDPLPLPMPPESDGDEEDDEEESSPFTRYSCCRWAVY